MLTPRKAAFVAEYIVSGNATQSAITAGYSPATAKQQGSRLLTDVDVKRALVDSQATGQQRVAKSLGEAVGSAAWIIRNAAETHEEARENHQYGAAVSALALLARPLPEFSEKHEIEAKVGVMLVRQTRGLRDHRPT